MDLMIETNKMNFSLEGAKTIVVGSNFSIFSLDKIFRRQEI